MNWSDLSEKDKSAIEREYRSGKEPGEIAARYGLKPKQVSDQAYRKNWSKGAGKKKTGGRKKTADKGKKKTANKSPKQGKKKAAKKKAKKKGKG